MATLDELNEKVYPPLDIMSPIATQRGLPTQQFSDRQRQFERTIIAQHNENRAAINEEAEVRAGADFANALYVNQATAEALGFEAGVMMRMEAGVTPAGVVARYQIQGRIEADGVEYTNGVVFDFIEDPDNPGEYLGQIQLDADRLKLGKADEDGTFPFYIDAGVVYIENAVIKNLSIGTEKVALNAITDLVVAYQGGAVGVGATIVSTYVPGASAANDTGVLVQLAGFMDKPVFDAGNFGYWQVQLYRNGSLIASSPALFYDDNFAYPVVMAYADATPGANPLYAFVAVGLSGPCNFTVDGSIMLASLFKR